MEKDEKKMVKEEKGKEVYSKPEIKKYPLIQQTTGYVIYYYKT